jgi:quinoprotein glucose dehydrogenase
MGSGELRQLLGHPDQRVRLAAEWGLAVASDSEYLLRDAALLPNGPLEPPFARLHAIWGLGIMARHADEKLPGSGAKILEPLVPLLEDNDPNVCALAARVLGEQGVGAAFDGLIKALRNPEERVSMFAAEALAKLGRPEALPQLLLMVREGGDYDPYRRHAYVDALVGMNDFSAIEQAARHDSPTVRRVALLAMRQLRRPEIAPFVHDEEPSLVVEAARAIHDENISEALPQLAALIEKPIGDEALMCRVLNANFRLGQSANAAALATYAAREDAAEALRMDALKLLSCWAHPPPDDYVTGALQSLGARDVTPAREALTAELPRLQASKSPGLAAAAAAAREALQHGAK